ncbi:VOC family protein [Psychroserpens sp.]|uniref:VOC family protein n=1 Tax=Psychroserpens sp. TaxID=2020870 RepID=UPI001B0251EA|nr:VOC family protein [Psychroserpens sp.]MBO6606105.1 VOC family protein [Psychroserpens sp.]MBO6630613.1 VOC family protein [Psychroserpens sp.]MBO6652524.1 VOC family protein [Psychroserpens sp.]MBO6681704.1 VOC family protein [Psychroserpens sp.]MBO6749479.1 VOC family protein [Psychroserpens sp.]
MIKGLYETHLYVEQLERSVAFYSKILGLKLCRFNDERRTAFFWIGNDKQHMLGLWEKPKKDIDIRHFAFECDPDWIRHESVDFLKSHNLNFWNFLQDNKEQPMVFCWMPAIAIYFNDPDGHHLEFIGVLTGETKSDDEKRVVTYEEWLELSSESNSN